MKRLIYLINIFSLLHILQAKCQTNLVPNPSFEQYTNCPPGYIDICVPWQNPTTSSNSNILAGFFSSCSTNGCCGVPLNIFGSGYQYARTGSSYASMFISQYYGSSSFIKHYIQTPLVDSLAGGHYYYVEFYTNLVNRSMYACNNIGLLVSKNAPTFAAGQIISATPQILNYGNPIITDTLNWIKVSGVYKATGGESFITIGDFKTDAQTDTIVIGTNNPLASDCAQYNIDDVSVLPLDSFCLKADAGRDTTIKVGDSVFIGSLTNGLDSIKWYANGITLIDSTRPGFWVKPAASGSYFYVLQQVVNGCFSKDTVYVNVTPLPLKMISYKLLMINERQVENRWTTANEINVSHFYVQRSTDGKDFTIIHKEQAKNQALNNYSFIDEAPNEGVNYYRVVSVDRDGKVSYSEVRNIEVQGTKYEVRLFPNPSKDVVNIECKDGIKEVSLFDMFGREMLRQAQHDGNTHHLSLNINHYPKGVYVVQVTTAKGEVKNGKLMIK